MHAHIIYNYLKPDGTAVSIGGVQTYITHLIPYPTKQENGAVAHRVPATWYGWRSKETHEWKIIPRYAILRGLAIISPIILSFL